MPETVQQSSITVAESDYPALFLAADTASRRAQSRYLRFTAVVLAALVFSAGLAAVSHVFKTYSNLLTLASAVVAALSFMITAIRKALKPEKLWYSGRAVAEAAKSLAWRYMTDSDPYPASMPMTEADSKFISDLKSMARDRGQVALGLGSEFSDRPQITQRMREVRSSGRDLRRQVYIAARIDDQRKWYAAKARRSQRVANWYFVLIQLSQALMLAATVLLFSQLGATWNLVGVFSALASALIAWLQVRQHEEQAQSYSLAALDLGFIEEQAGAINTDAELSAFVANAENTFGSEQSLWIARRTQG